MRFFGQHLRARRRKRTEIIRLPADEARVDLLQHNGELEDAKTS